MRILVVGSVYPDSFADNLVSSLADAGHTMAAVAPFTGKALRARRVAHRLQDEVQAFPSAAKRLQRHVLEAAEEHRPDLVLNVDYRLSYVLVSELRSVARAPVVFWFPDALGNLGREMHVLAGYDALFLKDTAVVERYSRVLRINAHFLPEACNPRWHRPVGSPALCDRPSVLLVGNMYATRFVLLNDLLAHGVDVVVEGPRWARWLPQTPLHGSFTGRYLAREDKARAFSAAPVVLNSLASHEADGLNCRLFEAAACGAVVLSEWRPCLPQFFDVENEVRAYRDFDELLTAIEELCGLDLNQRQRLGVAASKRAHAEHTYTHRFETILAALSGG